MNNPLAPEALWEPIPPVRTLAYAQLQGASVGPALADSLEDTYEEMWVQGVGGAYTAGFPANLLPGGTTQGAIDEAKGLFTMAHDKCPDSVILAGGYRWVKPRSSP